MEVHSWLMSKFQIKVRSLVTLHKMAGNASFSPGPVTDPSFCNMRSRKVSAVSLVEFYEGVAISNDRYRLTLDALGASSSNNRVCLR
jgi:hypothetical protein